MQLDQQDWDTIRHDLTNEIEVPALFWADGETPILVSVRRKSSRALPSEANPIKVGLKIDVNELVDGQKWRDLTKLSLENGADSGVVQEGLAWNLHRLASSSYGYDDPAHHRHRHGHRGEGGTEECRPRFVCDEAGPIMDFAG